MEKSLRPIVDHIKEKAPAYALAVVVGVGSLALMGEGDGENPSKVTHGDQPAIGAPEPTHESTLPDMRFSEFREQQIHQQELLEDR